MPDDGPPGELGEVATAVAVAEHPAVSWRYNLLVLAVEEKAAGEAEAKEEASALWQGKRLRRARETRAGNALSISTPEGWSWP